MGNDASSSISRGGNRWGTDCLGVGYKLGKHDLLAVDDIDTLIEARECSSVGSVANFLAIDAEYGVLSQSLGVNDFHHA